jgi:predicted RND superfamily exporter protein/outer membrane lipoprotein-sorting protein
LRRWFSFVLDHPWAVIGVVVLITVVTGSFIPKITFNASIDAMIPADDPVLVELAEVVEDFGTQDLFLIALQSEDVFSPAVLKKLNDLALELEALPGVAEVQSPFNAQRVDSSFFGIEIAPMTSGLPQSPEAIQDFKETILDSPYAGRLITADGRGAALFLELENFISNRNQLMEQIEEIVGRYQGPERIHMVGDAYILYFTEQAMKEDLVKLVPFVVVIIGIVLYATLRSALGIVIPLVTVGTSVIWTVGLMIWRGIPVSIISMVMPVILVTIGIASSIHILNKYQEGLAAGLSKRKALEETFAAITSPVAMAALTTAAGFASLITAFVHPIREFGVLTAIGVMLAMALSLSLVPALLILVREPKVRLAEDKPKKDGLLTRILHTFVAWATHRPKLVVAGVALVLVLSALGAGRITLESNIVNYFGDSSPVKQATMVIEEVFGGSMQISVVVDTGEEDGIKDPAVLQELVVIQEYLDSWNAINHATSIADVIRELNQALWDGDPEFYAIPDSKEAVAQQLLLFSMQGGSGIDSLVTYDYSRALVTAQMKTLDAEEMGQVMGAVESFLQERYGSGSNLSVYLSGTPKVMMRLMNRYVQTQVSSLISSTIGVGIIVGLLMKSVSLGLLSLIPLVFTVVINFGIMGFAGLPLDAVTSMISSVAIGIGVDYAIHYISRYRWEAAAGQGNAAALRITGTSAGRAILFNALALITGFLVLVFSHFRAIGVFGLLISAAMIVSSLAALLVIPLLLNYNAKRQERGKGMKKTVLLVLALVLTLSVAAGADSRTGQEILDELTFQTILSGSGSAEITMITENAKGAQRSYSLQVYVQMTDEGDAQFLEYLAPADVRGTKFLSINPKEGENQMWLYMPALGRERRIASHMTGDSFMGTDFTYEEIGGNFDYEDDYNVQRLGDQVEQGVNCYLLELTAKASDAPYDKVRMWVWQEKMVPVKIEFYAGENLTKTLTLSDFQLVSGELIPHHVVMANNVQGTRTILELQDVSQEDVSPDVFTVRNLRR